MLIFFRKFARNENKKKNARAYTLPAWRSQACVSAGHAFLKQLLAPEALTGGPEALKGPELLKLLKPFLCDRNIFKMPLQK